MCIHMYVYIYMYRERDIISHFPHQDPGVAVKYDSRLTPPTPSRKSYQSVSFCYYCIIITSSSSSSSRSRSRS